MKENDRVEKHKQSLIKDAWEKRHFGIAAAFRSSKLERYPSIVEAALMEIVGNKLLFDKEATDIFDLFRRSLFYVYEDDYAKQTDEMFRLLKSLPDAHWSGDPGHNHCVYYPELKESIVSSLCLFGHWDMKGRIMFFLELKFGNGLIENKKFWRDIIRKSLDVSYAIEFDQLISLAGEYNNAPMYEAVVSTLSMARMKNYGADALVAESRKRIAEASKIPRARRC